MLPTNMLRVVTIDRCEGSVTGKTTWTHCANLQRTDHGTWELNEQGCFDEIAQRAFSFALGSGLLQEPSSEDVEIQLDKSVQIVRCGEQEYIDGIYLSGTRTLVNFSASSFDGSEIYCYDIEEIEREDVIKVVKELIKMCKED